MSQPTIRAVAFDMDGLMFNTEDLYDQVGQILLERRGQIFTRELKLEMMGLPGSIAFQIMKDRCSLKDSIEQLKSETEEIFLELLPREIQTMPGLMDLLELIEEKGLPKCVCTSSHRAFATKALGMFDLEPRFKFVLAAENVEQGKPNPEVYLSAAARFGLESNQMLILEDSFTGSTAGAASGGFTVAVPTEHSRELDFSHVRFVATSLADPRIGALLEA